MMYLLNDSRLVDELRKLGFSIIQANQAGGNQFAVLRTPELDEFLRKNYADCRMVCSNVLCF